jgi:undecaprenyl-diphosphatase
VVPLGRVSALRVHALCTGLVLLAAAGVLVIGVAASPTDPPWQPLDDHWLAWMQDHRTAWATRVARWFSTVGSSKVTVPIRLLVVLILARRHRWLQLGAFAGAVITSELCIGPLKALIDRPRPPMSMIETSSSSFPSGHAIAGAVTAFGLAVVLAAPRARRWWWIGGASAFAGVMALSRTYLGAHWLSDVVAGVLIGTGLALVWPSSLELLRARRRRTTSASQALPAARR